VQAAQETGYGRFGGVVKRSFHNWCGLKTRQGGNSNDPNAHARFPDDETGVRAHLQHLALYAGVDVQGEIVDPRYFPHLRGTATTVEALGGKWATSPEYGQLLVRNHLQALLATPVPATPGVPDWKRKDHDELLAAGILTESHLATIDNAVPKWMLFALIN